MVRFKCQSSLLPIYGEKAMNFDNHFYPEYYLSEDDFKIPINQVWEKKVEEVLQQLKDDLYNLSVMSKKNTE